MCYPAVTHRLPLYDDRIVIINPGKLYGGLTIDELSGNDYAASHRNILLTEAFYLIGDVEKYGTGFMRIHKEISEYPGLQFSYEEVGGSFKVIIALSASSKVSGTTQKTTQKKSLSDRVIDVIRRNSNITQKDIAKVLGISPNTVKEYLANLKREGKLKRVGSDRAGYWKIIE